MATVNACDFPDELWYGLEENCWVRVDPDGCVTLGLTDPGQTKAGRVLAVTFRPVGKFVRRGRGGAVLESAKWVGRLVLPVSGKIVAVNSQLVRDPGVINRDPYGEGWFLRLEPSGWEEAKGFLARGSMVVEYYREKLAQEDLSCVRCADGMAPDHEWKKVGL